MRVDRGARYNGGSHSTRSVRVDGQGLVGVVQTLASPSFGAAINVLILVVGRLPASIATRRTFLSGKWRNGQVAAAVVACGT